MPSRGVSNSKTGTTSASSITPLISCPVVLISITRGPKSLAKCQSLESSNHGIRKVNRGSLPPKIASQDFGIRDHCSKRFFNPCCCIAFVKVFQHQNGRLDQGSRVGYAAAGNIRRGSVYRLKYSDVLADVRTRYYSEAADQPGSQI